MPPIWFHQRHRYLLYILNAKQKKIPTLLCKDLSCFYPNLIILFKPYYTIVTSNVKSSKSKS